MPLLWAYPQGPLPPHVEYSVEIEADEHAVTVLVARDSHEVLQGVAVAIGDDPSDLGEVLSMWGIGFPPDDPTP
jgi:hypothetical protein